MRDEDGLPNALPPLAPALERIGRAYGSAVERHGPRAGGVGWSSETGQMLRLRVLMRILDDAPPAVPVSIADLGCGYGALWPLLAGHAAPRVAAYTGYDICRPMIARARALHGADPRVRFLLADAALEDADYGMVSGTFNFRDGESEADWVAYLRASLRAFAGCCRKGLAFNLLHRRTARHLKSMYYADPAEMAAFARTIARGGTVAVIDDYLPDDFTVLVRFGA
ncbi:class I SAM-dependent methyltransferase [Novispirillum sp. DQ9]|uniref:class I SAM-dependent methyltransferase n=1 Tax=Novispirillum sp. DQ9 TaxID=3398612 RepID=UPI003C7D527E